MRTLLFLTVLFFALSVVGQESKEDVIVSSGNTIINESGSVDWIIGVNLIDSDVELGLYQPKTNKSDYQNGYIVYPTKTIDWIIIDKKQPDLHPYLIEVIDVAGKSELLSNEFTLTTRLDISSLASGNYFIKILDKDKIQLAIFQVVKEKE